MCSVQERSLEAQSKTTSSGNLKNKSPGESNRRPPSNQSSLSIQSVQRCNADRIQQIKKTTRWKTKQNEKQTHQIINQRKYIARESNLSSLKRSTKNAPIFTVHQFSTIQYTIHFIYFDASYYDYNMQLYNVYRLEYK